MDVSSVGSTGQSTEVQAKASSAQQQPPPPPEPDSVDISEDAQALASSAGLDK